MGQSKVLEYQGQIGEGADRVCVKLTWSHIFRETIQENRQTHNVVNLSHFCLINKIQNDR